jgi:hypothetical protein
MEAMATSFFQNLYTRDDGVQPEPLLNLVGSKITAETNSALCKPFTDEEISDALFQIGPLKAPGPDGFPARFFQRNWEALRNEVIRAVREFFTSGVMAEGANTTAIVIIPKKEQAENLKDFRPISLCNVIYKIVSKCMVNHLRHVLQEVISPNQSAFIPRRLITDNA